MCWLTLALVVLFIAYTYRWTKTPHGHLDYRAALSLHLLSFKLKVRPNPETDIKMDMPVNLIYILSALVPKEKVAQTDDITISGNARPIPARLYWPQALETSPAPVPLIVYFHGGGFVAGSVDLFDPLARSIARSADAILLSVEYRLAPAHPYPAAVEDCYTALCWAAGNAEKWGADPARLVVAGDSAGGNLAAVVTLKARDEGGPPISAQLLYYPATDVTDRHYPGFDHFIEGYGLSRAFFEEFECAYLANVSDRSAPYLSPLYAESHANLPPALLVTAGFDPLTDSALAYGRKLEQAGVHVTYHHYPNTFHGFMGISLFYQRREGLNDTREFLKDRLRFADRA